MACRSIDGKAILHRCNVSVILKKRDFVLRLYCVAFHIHAKFVTNNERIESLKLSLTSRRVPLRV